MIQRTPGQWEVYGTIIRAIKNGRSVQIAEATLDMPIGRDIQDDQRVPVPEALANAAFIVLACNNFEALLGIAQEIEAAMALADCPSSELVASMNAIDRLRPHLRAVIAATEGRAA